MIEQILNAPLQLFALYASFIILILSILTSCSVIMMTMNRTRRLWQESDELLNQLRKSLSQMDGRMGPTRSDR